MASVGPYSAWSTLYATSPLSLQHSYVGVIIPILQRRKVKLRVEIAELICNKARIEAWICEVTSCP